MQIEFERGRRLPDRKVGEGGMPYRRGAKTSTSKAMRMDETGTKTSHKADIVVTEGRRNHIEVIFWLENGVRHQGHTPIFCGETVFVESKQAVPLGTDLTIALTESSHDVVGWGAVAGTVVWHCPFPDHFKNRPGFGVLLRSSWLQLGSTEAQELKGVA